MHRSQAFAEIEQLILQASQLSQQGQLAAVVPLLERVLPLQEQVLESDHPDIAKTLTTLAGLHLI